MPGTVLGAGENWKNKQTNQSVHNALVLRKNKWVSVSKMHESDYREFIVVAEAKSKAYHGCG